MVAIGGRGARRVWTGETAGDIILFVAHRANGRRVCSFWLGESGMNYSEFLISGLKVQILKLLTQGLQTLESLYLSGFASTNPEI